MVEALVRDLKPHPRNYRQHPPDQIAHIRQSIEEHGVYRNIVVARDWTILAGHGVVKTLTEMGRERAPVIKLDIDPDSPAALKLLAGDNEIGHLAMVDDKTFTALLMDVKDAGGLLGTGYDEAMLANLIYVTNPQHEVEDRSAAWSAAGMPEYAEGGDMPFRLIVSFRNPEDRERFAAEFNLDIEKREGRAWVMWWPPREHEDTRAIRFEPVATTQ